MDYLAMIDTTSQFSELAFPYQVEEHETCLGTARHCKGPETVPCSRDMSRDSRNKRVRGKEAQKFALPSSSAIVWLNPTLCGTCLALAPHTIAYLKLSLSVR